MRSFILLISTVFFLLLPVFLTAQEETPPPEPPPEESAPLFRETGRLSGDSYLSPALFLTIPLFNIDPTNEGDSSIKDMNITPGGGVAMSGGAYVSSRMRLGGGMSFGMNFDPNTIPVFLFGLNGDFAYEIPIYADPRRRYPLFTIPLEVGIGMMLLKYDALTYVDPVFRPGISFYWNPPNLYNWSFGTGIKYWFMPEFALDGRTRIANMVEISIGFRYHFY